MFDPRRYKFTHAELERYVYPLKQRIADLESQLAAANARVEALEFALTPSVETKAAYWGERTNNWTLIKGVMADIKALAAARGE